MKPSLALHVSAALALWFSAPYAAAQEADALPPEGESIELETVTVTAERPSAWQSPPGMVGTRSATATKTDTRIVHTPASVSVVTRDQMNAQGVETVAQALRYTPGTFAESRISPRYDSLMMRGFGGFGGNANFIRHLDGHRMPGGLSYLRPNVDPYLLERIDVVRGANSVLHGQVSPGGVVNQITKRAYFTPKGEVEVSAGTQAQRFVGFDVNRPLGGEDASVALRLNGLYRSSESETGIGAERYALAPSLTWKGAQTELTVHALWQRDPEGGDYNAVPAYGTIVDNPQGKLDRNSFIGDKRFERFDRRTNTLGYRFSHSWNDNLVIRHNLLYTDAESVFRNTSLVQHAGGTAWARRATAADEGLRGINTDVQLRWRFHTGAVRHTLNMGVDYQNTRAGRLLGNGTPQRVDTLNLRAYDGTTAVPAFATDSRSRQSQWGVFVQDQLEAGRWLAQLGIRHDRVHTRDQVANLRTGALTQQSDRRDSKTTYQAGLMYRADSGLSPYLSYSTSFEPTATVNNHGAPFRPTTAEQWELGVKYQPRNHWSLFGASVFQLTRDNVLTKDLRPGAPGDARIQTGQIRVRGLELEARAEWTPQFSTIAALTWISPEITRTNSAAEQGKVPVGIPRRTASLWGQYGLLDNRLKLSAGVRYVGSTFADAANTYTVPGYTLFDAGASYDFGHASASLRGLTARLNIQNLTDKRHFSACYSADETAANPRRMQCFEGNRRSIVFGLNYNW